MLRQCERKVCHSDFNVDSFSAAINMKRRFGARLTKDDADGKIEGLHVWQNQGRQYKTETGQKFARTGNEKDGRLG